MKCASWQPIAFVLLSLQAGSAVQVQRRMGRLVTVNANRGGAKVRSTVEATIEAKFGHMMGEMLTGMLAGQGPSATSIAKLMHNKMSINDALSQLDGRLPEEVASIVRLSSTDGGQTPKVFDEDSLQKARKILNNMIIQAWKELDDVIFESKEFEERNRGTYEQVVGDIARLGAQLAALGDVRVDASEGIMEQDRMRKETEQNIMLRTKEFEQTKLLNDAEMKIRKNDLAVFDMILMMTKCPEEVTLLQLGAKGGAKSNGTHAMQVCETASGLSFKFDDPKLQARVERMMTPEARRALREALGQVAKKVEFFQLDDSKQSPVMNSNATTTGLPTYGVETSPVSEEPHPSGQWKKCTDGTPNCGLLHDLMSLEWGRFRDSFDELATEMKKNQDVFDAAMINLNEQLNVINAERTKNMEMLAQTISAINADTEESNEKEEQKRDLEEEYDKRMATFRAAIEELLYTRICAVRKVRNEILHSSTLSPPSKISDCDFTDWYPRDGVCIGIAGTPIDCDDTCPQADPYKCGGLEWMVRDIVVMSNEYGMQCSSFNFLRQKKCKQIKCPVDCVESEWSAWSKCTKECEGGVKVRTRSILTKAKNGGKACDTVQEETGCNTGSCDRDCSLDVWSDWSPCSMACSGGITERKRVVVVPIRGQGKCPTEKSVDRFEKNECNTHDCVGDEICIARQDLVLAIDGSGSLRESGFEVVREFSANLTSRYQSMYYGEEDMKLGVVFFGNGHLNTQPDGTTSIEEAIYVQGLTGDIALVGQKIQELQWARGFTNMAQGFQMADVMLAQTGRADAQSAVLVISDGKYSMAYQTAEKAQELKDKNIMIYLVPITEVEGSELSIFRQFSSFPHETNYQRIPGLTALEFNTELFTGKIIAKFCPKAFSPSQEQTREVEQEYMMIRESGYPSDSCGTWTWHGMGFNIEDCRMEAINLNRSAFAFGKGKYMLGGCYSEAIAVTDEMWTLWLGARENVPCEGGTWINNPYFDTYAIKPTTVTSPL